MKPFARVVVLVVVVLAFAIAGIALQAVGTVLKVASCVSVVNNACLQEAAMAIAAAWSYRAPPTEACTSLDETQRLDVTKRIDPNATREQAIEQGSSDPRVRLTLDMTSGYMNNFGEDPNRPGEFGIYGIMPGVGAAFKDVDEAEATQIASATAILAVEYERLVQDTVPADWQNAPAAEADKLIAAVYAEHTGYWQRAANPGTEQKLKVYEQSLDTMKRNGWSIDFVSAAAAPSSGGTASGASPPGTIAGMAVGNLDAAKVPEPFRTIWLDAVKAEGMDPNGLAPGFIAGLHLNENNGFPWANREIDGGEGAGAYASITKDSPEWRLDTYKTNNGIWPTTNSNFQGPGQFDIRTGRAWDSFGRDGDGDGVKDVHSFIDSARAEAAYLKYLVEQVGGGDFNSFDSFVKAAAAYNGQGPFYGGIKNPGGRFERISALYAYQAGEIAKALVGGDRNGQTVLNSCVSETQDIALVAFGGGQNGAVNFPLETTKQSMLLNNEGCIDEVPAMCRAGHPYAAYDIIAETGTPVISLYDGVVQYDGEDLYGHMISVYSPQLEVTVSYLHMSMQTEKQFAHDGDTVRAGQKLGLVGTAAEGSTIPHLHIDAAAAPSRPGCSRANCPVANQAIFTAGDEKIGLGKLLHDGFGRLP